MFALKTFLSALLRAALLDQSIHAAGSNVTSNTTIPSATVGPNECLVGWQKLNFNGVNFEAYPSYFRENSYMTLAQSGTYSGLEGIEEYVRYSTPYSPFFDTQVRMNSSDTLLGIEGDTCIFSGIVTYQYTFNETFTGPLPPYDIALLNHLYYSVSEDYISKWHVYFSDETLKLFFADALGTQQVGDYICESMTNTCGYEVESGTSCQEKLEALPMLTNGTYFDGNSKACRNLHGVFARLSPANHCPHIAFEPTPDPNENIKCQKSKLVKPTPDLFTEDDIALFEKYCEENGIDPGLGYRAVENAKQDIVPEIESVASWLIISQAIKVIAAASVFGYLI